MIQKPFIHYVGSMGGLHAVPNVLDENQHWTEHEALVTCPICQAALEKIG